MVAQRLNLSQHSTARQPGGKLRHVHATLRMVRMLSAKGQSLFWQPLPPHNPVVCHAGTAKPGDVSYANVYALRSA